MSRATNIIAGNSKITSQTLHADWCTRIMGFDVIRHHGETEQRHGCICKGLGQSYMYPFKYSMKITERNPKNSNENEKRRQKVKSAKSAKMGKGNIFLNHRIMFSYKIPH